MNLDPDICYRAVTSRDRRFDGRFFTAVSSTGVYCRPVCPARTPRRENCTFFVCAAAAEEAGYRPCLRCRPETSPGTPAWQGTSATVSRALKLIEDGALDSQGVDGLAARLGVGARHLRRLFSEHLGASPLAVALTRRIHFAKTLIDQTGLPMTQIALSAGFGSIRRFNAAISRTFGRSPSELRRLAGHPAGMKASGSRTDGPYEREFLTLRLDYRTPFAWADITAFLGPRAIPGVETVGRDFYRRLVATGDALGIIEVRPGANGSHLELRVPHAFATDLGSLVDRVRRLFDLGADPASISQQLRGDPQLAPLVRSRPGLRVPGAWDRFELAVRAILGQQITVRAATSLAGKLVRAFGRRRSAGGDPGLDHLFPGPEVLARADIARIGMPAARAETIRQFSRAAADGTLDLAGGSGLEESLARLRSLPGIGEWTAQYIALRALGEPDAFPAGDLGLRRSLAALTGVGAMSAARLGERAEAWRPWRAYAAMQLWLHESRK